MTSNREVQDLMNRLIIRVTELNNTEKLFISKLNVEAITVQTLNGKEQEEHILKFLDQFSKKNRVSLYEVRRWLFRRFPGKNHQESVQKFCIFSQTLKKGKVTIIVNKNTYTTFFVPL